MPSFHLSTWEKEDFIEWYGVEAGTKLWNEQISSKYIKQITELKQRVSELEGIIEHNKGKSVTNMSSLD